MAVGYNKMEKNTHTKKKSIATRNKMRRFCVVQFIEKPIVGMDDYACVPRSYVITIQDRRVVVAYPKDEDPFDTRKCAEKTETNGGRWKFYSAILRYESDIYEDAQSWIASRKDYVPIEEDSDIRDARPEPVLDKKLRSNIRNSTSNSKTNKPQLTEKPLETSTPISKKSPKRIQSEPEEELKKKRFKLDEAAKTTRTYVDYYANPTPGCSKTEESIIFRNDPLIRSDQTEKTAAASSGGKTTTKLSSNTRNSTSNSKTNKPQLTEKPLETSTPISKKSPKRIQSEPEEELKKKRSKLDEAAKTTRTYVDYYANPTPGCSKTEESIIFRNDPLIQSDQTEKTAAASSGGKTTTKLSSNTRNSTSNSKTNKPQLAEKPVETSRMPISKKSPNRIQSEPDEELMKKRPKLDEAAKSTRTYVDYYANSTPGCSKTEESIIFRNDPLIQSDQTEKTAEASSGRKTTTKLSTKLQSTKENKSVAKSDSKNPRHSNSFKQTNKQGDKQSSPVLQDCKQLLSMPLLDVDEPIGVINSDKEIQPESITEQIPPASQIPSHTSQMPCQPEYVQDRKTAVKLCPDNILPVPRTQEVSVRQSKETNRHGQTTHLHGDTMAARATAPTTTNQFSQLYQDPNITNKMPSTSHHLPNSVKPSSSLFFDNMTGKPSLSATQNPVSKNMDLENITRKIATTVPNSSNQSSSILACSVKKQAPLVIQNQSQDGLREQQMHSRNHIEGNGNDQKELNSIDHKTIDQDIANNTSAAQIPSNLAHHSGGFGQQSIARQDLLIQKYYALQIADIQDILRRNNGVQSNNHSICFQDTINEAYPAQSRSNPANQPGEFHTTSHENTYLAVDNDLQQKRLSQELRRRSTEINNTEHRPPSRNSRIPSAVSSIRGFEQHIQFPPNDNYSQRDPRLTGKRVDISMKSNNKSQRPGPQGVTKQTPGLTKASDSMGQASLSNGQNNINVAAVPQNITEPSLFMHNGKVPATFSYHQSHEIQRTPVHQNHVYRDPRTQKLLVDQSTETNLTMKRIYCEDDRVRSPATESSPRVVDSACQTDESFIRELLSPYLEVDSDYEISTEEAPDEIVNDIDYTGEKMTPESDPADRLMSGNHQVHPRWIAEQQMLNEFANLFKQMAPTLSYTSDMFKNLKSGILESVETYKRLLVAVATFNALGKSEPSQETEERRTGEVERERSGNGGEDFNNRVNCRVTDKNC